MNATRRATLAALLLALACGCASEPPPADTHGFEEVKKGQTYRFLRPDGTAKVALVVERTAAEVRILERLVPPSPKAGEPAVQSVHSDQLRFLLDDPRFPTNNLGRLMLRGRSGPRE